jgi:hypothetical protein
VPDRGDEIIGAIRAGVFDTEKAFAKALDAPVSAESVAEAMDQSGREYMFRLQEYWNSTLVERLRPYAFEFGA